MPRSSLLLGLPRYALGGDITATERELWLAEPQTQQKAEELYLLALHNEVDRLQFNLQRISYPAQEVVRFLLLQKFEQGQLILTEELAVFIAVQNHRHPII